MHFRLGNIKYLFTLALLFIIPQLAIAQIFQLGQSFSPGLRGGDIAWGDIDNDGRLDFIQTGNDINAIASTRLFKNTVSGFVEVSTTLPKVFEGAVDWGDFDNDGDQDLLIAGFSASDGTTIARVYKNEDWAFIYDQNIILEGMDRGSVEWGDYDVDGDLDILICGQNANSASISKIYQNNNYTFKEVFENQITGVSFGESKWIDFDSDGDLDILITGVTGTAPNTGPKITKLYKNTGTDFLEVFENSFEDVSQSSMSFGDFDNDGDLDILLSGFTNSNTAHIAIYQNNGSGGFQIVYDGELPPIIEGKAIWIDYDNDGDLDVFITGNKITPIGIIAELYANNGSGFDFAFSFDEAAQSAAEAADLDNDGDLDIIISGQKNDTTIYSSIYLNQNTNTILSTNPNLKPTPPTNLEELVTNNEAILSWVKATDAETSQNGLTYNVYIRIITDTIVSPMSIINGKRKLLKRGNTGHINSYSINNLDPGDYFWAVQAIDNSHSGSSYSVEGEFTIDVPLVTSIEPIKSNGVSFYPNPAKNRIVIESANNSNPTIVELFNLQGQSIFKKYIHLQNENNFELKDVPPGVYIIRIKASNRETFKRIVVE